MIHKGLKNSCHKNHCLYRSLKRTNTVLQTVKWYIIIIYFFISTEAIDQFDFLKSWDVIKFLPLNWQRILTPKHTSILKPMIRIFIEMNILYFDSKDKMTCILWWLKQRCLKTRVFLLEGSNESHRLLKFNTKEAETNVTGYL